MLGLRRGTVELCEYSTDWPLYFEQEKSRMLSVVKCQIMDIQHIGSTSIPGLKAKPILDIGIEIGSVQALKRMIRPLEKLGYTYFGDRAHQGDYFFAKGPDERRTHYLHISSQESGRLPRDLAFRDALRTKPALRNAYQQLKEQLATTHRADRQTYTERKAAFIQMVIEQHLQPNPALT